jgi:hypothetical protein
MPTYEEALAANPAAFVDYAAEMSAAAAVLTEHRAEYDAKVVEINAGWEDTANTAFNADAVVVDDHVEEVVSQVGDAAELLDAGGAAMESMVEQLKATDASYRGAGFNVQPAPKVELGAVHWAAIAAAGPFGPMLQALFQARADEGTMQLQLGLSVLTATDAATGAGLTGAAEQLEPLADKASSLERTDHRTDIAADEDDRDTTGKDTAGKGDTKQDDDKDGKDSEGSEKDEDDKDMDAEDADEEQDPEDPKAEDDQDGQQDPQQDPERPGAEAPGAVDPGQPEVPGYEPPDPVDDDAPEIPGYESDWDPAELGEGAELPSGGLAGGGGGGLGGGAGGGLGSADLGATGGNPAGPQAVVGAPVGAAGGPATGTTGARGGVGGMVGAPGARGAGVPDDEYERDSLLTEDPDEDVWGIGTAENNPYVDYQDEQETEAEAPPGLLPAPDVLPPFTLPGFDVPEPKGP